MEDFGTLADGRRIGRIVLDSGALRVALLDLGAIVQDVRLAGIDFALTLGGAQAASYDGVMAHFGAIMGPVVNRISDARAMLDGRELRFEANQDGRHTRHGGAAGTHRKIWRLEDHGAAHACFAVDLPDGEGGFPGNRRLTARYRVAGTTLRMELRGETDAPTLMNLANHAYWRVTDGATWEGEHLQIAAEHYLPTTDEDLPTGEIAAVSDPYDFRAPRRLARGGMPKLDHNFCLAAAPRPLEPAVRLAGDAGVTLEIATTAPGIQVFDMGKFGVEEPTIDGHPYPRYAALAVEPQMWPDAPGRDGWPDIVLRPGEVFEQTTEYRFSLHR